MQTNGWLDLVHDNSFPKTSFEYTTDLEWRMNSREAKIETGKIFDTVAKIQV